MASSHRTVRSGRATVAPAASATMTITSSEAQPRSGSPINIPPSGTLRLRAEATSTTQPQNPEERQRRVQWAENVVNNEGMGKKRSKVCCIYHKPRPVDESSDEDSSDSSSSDNESDDGDGQGDSGPSNENRSHAHSHGPCNHNCKAQAKYRPPKPVKNAYEQVPKNS